MNPRDTVWYFENACNEVLQAKVALEEAESERGDRANALKALIKDKGPVRSERWIYSLDENGELTRERTEKTYNGYALVSEDEKFNA